MNKLEILIYNFLRSAHAGGTSFPLISAVKILSENVLAIFFGQGDQFKLIVAINWKGLSLLDFQLPSVMIPKKEKGMTISKINNNVKYLQMIGCLGLFTNKQFLTKLLNITKSFKTPEAKKPEQIADTVTEYYKNKKLQTEKLNERFGTV